MTINDIRTIGIVGSGTMGVGIAQVAALAGFEVVIHDSSKAALHRFESSLASNLEKAVELGKISPEQKEDTLGKIKIQPLIRDVEVDFVIEAVVEDLDIKTEIFSKLAENNSETILASNTSSIPITQIASKLEDPSKLVGLHFFNPAHIMKLVEVISGATTDPEIVAITMALAQKFGKTPVEVKDSPGFIVNRVARHYYVESLKVVEDNVCGFDELDKLMESSGFRMGPFRLMDLIGVDTNLSVTKTIYNQFHHDPKFRPNRIQQQLVDAGFNGRKSGKGFYNYKKGK
jgi:3-hydroxybutyryl-CoA dehydrogenase